jgi:hypothetical protein
MRISQWSDSRMMNPLRCLSWKSLGVLAWLVASAIAPGTLAAAPVTPEGFEYKTFVGYQAWFNVPQDGFNKGWFHWTRDLAAPTPSSMTVDMWPDLAEIPPGAQQYTGFTLGSGAPAYAYSGGDAGVIDTHFRWMKDYDIAGAFVQWFVGDDAAYRLNIMRKVRTSAELHGRKMIVMFDISGAGSACPSGPALVECLKVRWTSAVDAGITASSSYQRFKDKPLLAVWGMGIKGNEYVSAADALTFVNWVRSGAPAQYQASLMGGVAAGWRTNSGDAISSDGAVWQQVYASLDVISPWTVGRYGDDSSSSAFIRSTTGSDLVVIRQRNQRYLPVMFPGFSWRNLNGGPLNQIPRRGGQFLWNQAREYAALGVTSFYVAMFDEVDEGTAIYKTAATPAAAPVNFPNLTLAADGMSLPSDWYLQVARSATLATREPGSSGFITPGLPLVFTAGTLIMTPGEFRSGGGYHLAFQNDGNLVVYDASFNPLWASNTVGHSCGIGTCNAVFQFDGNFVLSDRGYPYWSTQTLAPGGQLKVTAQPPYLLVQAADGTPLFTSSATLSSPSTTFNLPGLASAWFSGGRLSFQSDGNLVVYADNGAPLWVSNTSGRTCAPTICRAVFQGDGNLVLLQSNVPYWSTGTGGSTAVQLQASASWPYLSLRDGQGNQVWPGF